MYFVHVHCLSVLIEILRQQCSKSDYDSILINAIIGLYIHFSSVRILTLLVLLYTLGQLPPEPIDNFPLLNILDEGHTISLNKSKLFSCMLLLLHFFYLQSKGIVLLHYLCGAIYMICMEEALL